MFKRTKGGMRMRGGGPVKKAKGYMKGGKVAKGYKRGGKVSKGRKKGGKKKKK